MKKYILLSIFVMMISCKDENMKFLDLTESPTYKDTIENNPNLEVNRAKEWLSQKVNHYFNNHNISLEEEMRKMTTQDYYQYKMDAMSVDLDGSLTSREFKNKWKDKFNISKAGAGVGFLISGQDWDSIKMSKCELVSVKDNTYLFDVILLDKGFKTHYPSQIKIIKSKTDFLIADVLQEQ